MIHWCCNLSVELVNIYSTITSFPPLFAFLKNFDRIWHIRFVGYQQILTFQEQCLESGNNSDKVCLNKEIKRKKIMTEEQSKITKSITESMSSEWQSSYFCRHLRLTLYKNSIMWSPSPQKPTIADHPSAITPISSPIVRSCGTSKKRLFTVQKCNYRNQLLTQNS